MIVSISRRVRFCAGHRLFNPEFDEEKNLEVFGECSNPHGHGHNYVLEAVVRGPVDPSTGMVINLKDLKRILEETVVDKVDHRNLNMDVEFMSGVIPTTENLARRIFELLDDRLGDGRLVKVTLWESENNRVEVARS